MYVLARRLLGCERFRSLGRNRGVARF